MVAMVSAFLGPSAAADKFQFRNYNDNDSDNDSNVDTAIVGNKILFHFIFFSKGSSLIFRAYGIALKSGLSGVPGRVTPSPLLSSFFPLPTYLSPRTGKPVQVSPPLCDGVRELATGTHRHPIPVSSPCVSVKCQLIETSSIAEVWC